MKAREDSNGNIKIYNSVPKNWGAIVCGFNALSDSELETHGFYNVITPSKKESQEYGDIEWDADNSVFVYPLVDKTYSETVSELKIKKIKNLKDIYNNKLSKTDWYTNRKSELGTAIPQDILDARAALRTECDTKEAEINAKTTKAEVVDYELPIL